MSKNPNAVALSKLGAKKGGLARAISLTPFQRRAIARKAAKTRHRTKVCPKCLIKNQCKKSGVSRWGTQRYLCSNCGHYFSKTTLGLTPNTLKELRSVNGKKAQKNSVKRQIERKISGGIGRKLTAIIVREIRDSYKNGGITHRQLAKKYMIARETVGNIIRKEIWAYI